MARGDGGKAVFETDDDRKSFVFRLGQVCASHGWRVHAWVLMEMVREMREVTQTLILETVPAIRRRKPLSAIPKAR